jgi:hypothetical protein
MRRIDAHFSIDSAGARMMGNMAQDAFAVSRVVPSSPRVHHEVGL